MTPLWLWAFLAGCFPTAVAIPVARWVDRGHDSSRGEAVICGMVVFSVLLAACILVPIALNGGLAR